MKELPIEQKAKAYDEVVNKLRHFIAQGVDPLITRADVQDFFPELKESEDEKIRKALIDGFTVMKESKNCGKTFSNHNIPVADILNWLEKQGEQKPAWSENDKKMFVNIKACLRNTNKDYSREIDWLKSIKPHSKNEWSEEDERIRKELITHCKNIRCVTEEGAESIAKWIDWLEKQGQEEPQVYKTEDGEVITYSEDDGYKVVEPKFKHGDRVRNKKSGLEQTLGGCIEDVYEGAFPFHIKDQDNWELVEQELAWSEEDERIRQCLIQEQEKALDDVRNDKYGHSEIISDLKEMYRERIDWLKSLKNRVRPKQEWSEEDKQYFNFLEKLLICLQAKSTENEIKKGTNSNSEYYYKVIRWLKSLKNRIGE